MTIASYSAPSAAVTRLLDGLTGIRRSGAGWTARCPAHDDRRASLSLGIGNDGRALVRCHAGCTTEAIVGALGLALSDLFPSAEPTVHPPRSNGGAGPRPSLYAIKTTAGDPVAVHVRHDTPSGKRLSWRLPDGTAGLGGTASAALPLFGSENLAKWSPDGDRPIIIAEGEKAALALLHAGFRALGTATGAASAPSVAVLESLRGHHVVLWPDNDDAGRQHMARIAERLRPIAADVRVIDWPQAPAHGDAADLLATAGPNEVDALLAAARPAAGTAGPVIVNLAAVRRERLDPLWHGYVYRGKVHLIEGDPDRGKSTLTLDLAARLSTGRPMPDGSPGIAPAGVVILSAEDGLADTIRPRLEAAGADLSRIVALTAIADATGERLPALPYDLGAVERAIEQVGAAMVIVDPLMAYLGADVNSWRDQDVRRALAPTAQLAERTRTAIVVVRHLNKSAGAHALYRGGGSIGIVAAARVALLVAADPDDEDRRVLTTVKNNLAPHPASLAFRLVNDSDAGAARVEWLGASEHRAAALLAQPSGDEERGALDEAVDVLRTILAAGPVHARQVEREAAEAGVSRATLRRAQAALGIRPRKVGQPGERGQRWEWALPEGAHEIPKMLTSKGWASSAPDGHLRGDLPDRESDANLLQQILDVTGGELLDDDGQQAAAAP